MTADPQPPPPPQQPETAPEPIDADGPVEDAEPLRGPDEVRTWRERGLWAGLLVLMALVAYQPAIRDLDTAIGTLQASIASDELTIKRLKKRKLQLKDQIARLESALIPDEPA